MTQRQCVIVDIDGTLADIDHRLHHIKPLAKSDGSYEPSGPRWKEFHEAMDGDSPHPEIIALANAMHNTGTEVVLCTGRGDETRKATKQWLEQHGVCFDRLLMRRYGDHRPDVEIKGEMLDLIEDAGLRPLFAVEDRKRVVEMWRERGVRCLQVCDGDY